jgi:AraC-like DNA-binding protein
MALAKIPALGRAFWQCLAGMTRLHTILPLVGCSLIHIASDPLLASSGFFMDGFSLTPSSALKVFRHTDIDDFRQALREVQLEFTPLSRRIAAQQSIVNLPGCDICLTRAFPRLVDAQLVASCTAVGFSVNDYVPIRFNGLDSRRTTFFVGHGGAGFRTFERVAAQFASIVFRPEVPDRGWPRTSRDFSTFETSDVAHLRLRELCFQILRVASEATDILEMHQAAEGIKESLLAAVDAAFADAMPANWIRPANAARYLKIIRDVEAVLSSTPGTPIYSSELARQIGVSVRTMHTAVQRYRGMSLHRYLRLRRLWLVRQRLLAGSESVKACALAHGFWHLGDFTRSYRAVFEETPSETLARSR